MVRVRAKARVRVSPEVRQVGALAPQRVGARDVRVNGRRRSGRKQRERRRGRRRGWQEDVARGRLGEATLHHTRDREVLDA